MDIGQKHLETLRNIKGKRNQERYIQLLQEKNPDAFNALRVSMQTSIDPKAFKGNVIDEQHPDVSNLTRFGIKSTVKPENFATALKNAYPDHDVINRDGDVLIKRKDETDWRKLDPGGFSIGETIKDVADVGTDIGQGILEGLGAGAGFVGGTLLGGPVVGLGGMMAGGGATATAVDSAKQGLANLLGYQEGFKPKQALEEGAWGSGFSLLPGGKNVVKPLASKLTKAQLNPVRSLANDVLLGISSTGSGIPKRSLKRASENIDEIMQANEMLKNNQNPILPRVRSLSENAKNSMDTLKQNIMNEKDSVLEMAGEVDISGFKDKLADDIMTSITKEAEHLGIKAPGPKATQKEIGKFFKKLMQEDLSPQTAAKIETLRQIDTLLPKGTDTVTAKELDNIKRSVQDIVDDATESAKFGGAKGSPTVDRTKARSAMQFRDDIVNELDNLTTSQNLKGYRQLNKEYAKASQLERELIDDKILPKDPFDMTPGEMNEEVLARQGGLDVFSKREESAIQRLRNVQPKSLQNLNELGKKTGNPTLGKEGEKLQVVSEFLDPTGEEMFQALPGKARTGILSKLVSGVKGGGLGAMLAGGGSAATGNAEMMVPAALAGYMVNRSLTEPMSILKRMQYQNKMGQFLESPAMQGLNYTQPLRQIPNAWESMGGQ